MSEIALSMKAQNSWPNNNFLKRISLPEENQNFVGTCQSGQVTMHFWLVQIGFLLDPGVGQAVKATDCYLLAEWNPEIDKYLSILYNNYYTEDFSK